MEKSSRPAQLEARIREITRELLELTITPHVRELRAKAVTYTRVIANWGVYSPTPPQLQAMVECITELEAKVLEAKRDGDRDVSKVTRRRSSEAAAAKGGSSLLPSAIPPTMGWSSAPPEASGVVRSRRSSQPQPTKRDSASEAPTRPPPPLSNSPPGTTPPVSAPRAIDEEDRPTPVPALLRSRRSH